MEFVELRDLQKAFGPTKAVDSLNLKITKGEFITLLGPSGCGKTTTLRMIAGFVRPDGGEIYVDGERINDKPPHRRNMGMVFQNYALFPHMTIFENVAFGLRMSKESATEIRRKVKEVLELVRLPGVGARMPRELSGGQQQRIALARALVIEPKVLLLDEPLSNLDFKLRMQMRLEIKSIHERVGITSISVTHDQGEALTMSDRLAIMSEGRLQQIGTPKEIYERPANVFVADFIGEANLIQGRLEQIGDAPVFQTERGLRFHVGKDTGTPNLGKTSFFCIRPDDISIEEKSTREYNSLECRIAQVIYRGSDIRYHAIVGGQEFIVNMHADKSGSVFAVDDMAYLEWPPENGLILDE